MIIDEEINQLKQRHKKELDNLYKKKEALSNLDPQVIRVAETLHKYLCTWNHTDGCGWFYDSGDWSEYSRKKYYQMAKEILCIVDEETITKIMEVTKMYK